MDLYLRKVTHPQATDNYRVILKDEAFKAAWEALVADRGWLEEFLAAKRRARRLP